MFRQTVRRYLVSPDNNKLFCEHACFPDLERNRKAECNFFTVIYPVVHHKTPFSTLTICNGVPTDLEWWMIAANTCRSYSLNHEDYRFVCRSHTLWESSSKFKTKTNILWIHLSWGTSIPAWKLGIKGDDPWQVFNLLIQPPHLLSRL